MGWWNNWGRSEASMRRWRSNNPSGGPYQNYGRSTRSYPTLPEPQPEEPQPEDEETSEEISEPNVQEKVDWEKEGF